jgi:hypothetical protein
MCHNLSNLLSYLSVTLCALRFFTLKSFPPETESQFVIPAKSAGSGREPGSRESFIILTFHWIPDIRQRRIPE